jgi:hypothetical protein
LGVGGTTRISGARNLAQAPVAREDRAVSVTATASVPSRSLGDTMAARLRETAIIVVGSGIAGALVGGVGSRVVMRIAALAAPEVRGALTENGNVVGEITLQGTIALMILAGLSSAVFGAGAFVVARPWLPRRTVLCGLVFGAFLLALAGAAVVDKGNADFVILGDRLLNVAMFSGLFFAFGLVASSAIAVLDRRVPPAASLSPRMWALTAVSALPIVPGVLGVAFAFGSQLGVPLIGAWVAMLSASAVDRRGRHGLAQLIRTGATAGMLAVVALAGAEYVDSVTTIL